MESVFYPDETPFAMHHDEGMSVQHPITLNKLRDGFVDLMRNYPDIPIVVQDPCLYNPTHIRDLQTGMPLDLRGEVLRENKTHFCLVNFEYASPEHGGEESNTETDSSNDEIEGDE